MRPLANMDLRKAMHDGYVTQIQLAAELGLCEMTVYRWMIAPVTGERRDKLTAAIARLTEINLKHMEA